MRVEINMHGQKTVAITRVENGWMIHTDVGYGMGTIATMRVAETVPALVGILHEWATAQTKD